MKNLKPSSDIEIKFKFILIFSKMTNVFNHFSYKISISFNLTWNRMDSNLVIV